MNRREFIELAGLTAAIPAAAGAAPDTPATIEPSDDRYQAAIERFPDPSVDDGSQTSFTITTAPVAEYLTDPDLLGPASVHVAAFTAGGIVATGIDGPGTDTVKQLLEERGYDQHDRLDRHDLYGKRVNRRFRGVLSEGRAVHVGLGPDPGTVSDLLTASLPGSPEPVSENGPVGTVLDLLGPITVADIERHTAGENDDLRAASDLDSPTVVGRRIALEGERASIRTAELYDSRAAARRAKDSADPSWLASVAPVSVRSVRQTGRATIKDAVTEASALPDSLSESR